MGTSAGRQREALNPYPWYRDMASQGGPQYDPDGDTWGVFRYDEILEALKAPEMFLNLAPKTASAMLASTVILRDAPGHRPLRQVLVSWFSARAAEGLKARIGEITHTLVGDFASAGGGDLIREIAVPLPIIIMADILGVPQADFRLFKEWCDAAASNGAPADDGSLIFDRAVFSAARENWGSDEVIDYFTALTRKRRDDPRDDLLSALAVAEIDGHRLPEREVAASCFQVLLAGNETTTNLIGNAVLTLDEHPETWREIREDPTLIPPMLEEVLRYRPSVHGVVRRVGEDTTWHGVDLTADSLVMLWLAAGNRDERVFADADRFDIRRTPNRHLAFGQGAHFCAGSSVARLEACTVFDSLLRRFADITVVDRDALRPLASATLGGVTGLPVTVIAA